MEKRKIARIAAPGCRVLVKSLGSMASWPQISFSEPVFLCQLNRDMIFHQI